jgi:hypothetical protein
MAFFIPFLLGTTVGFGGALAIVNSGGSDKRHYPSSSKRGGGLLGGGNDILYYVEILTEYGHFRTEHEITELREAQRIFARLESDREISVYELEDDWEDSSPKNESIPKRVDTIRVTALYLYETNANGSRKKRIDYTNL